jgi:hypothetical protein
LKVGFKPTTQVFSLLPISLLRVFYPGRVGVCNLQATEIRAKTKGQRAKSRKIILTFNLLPAEDFPLTFFHPPKS